MKKELFLLVALLLVACGDMVENISQPNMDIVASSSDLPECTQNNEGNIIFVKEENAVRVCVDGEWLSATESVVDTVDMRGSLSCTTVELDDGSGFKIVCNGDSIGVVTNGKNGADGAAGKDGTDGKDGSDGKVPVIGKDTLDGDSERVALSLDSLAGYSQKGPFLKGSTVYLYELSDGRTLKQTNGNFTSRIERDDGRYKFSARDLVCQYAMIVVKGNYRNEVTGEPSDFPIRLRALTDMRQRSEVNVNLLTHLEFDRVYYLVTREKKSVRQAKKQAQAEIFNAFHIDTTGFVGSSEDLDVFGATDADAALLAISILLQQDSNETALSVLLTEIANDLEMDGKWDDSTTRALIADWAATVDMQNQLEVFRNNVKGWGLGNGSVPEFEKYIRRFWSIESGLGMCGAPDNPVGVVRHIPNANSTMYYAMDYSDVSITSDRFICDPASKAWRLATDFEKDTVGFGDEHEEADVVHGKVNADLLYFYENGNWYLSSVADSLMRRRCSKVIRDTVMLGVDSVWRKCYVDDEGEWSYAQWVWASKIDVDTLTWGTDWEEGDVRNGRINTDSTYVFQNGHWRVGTALDSLLGQACIEDGKISDRTFEDYYYTCRNTNNGYSWVWKKVSELVNDTYLYLDECNEDGVYSDGRVVLGRVTGKRYVCDDGAFRPLGTKYDPVAKSMAYETYLGRGCVSYILDSSIVIEGQLSYYKCTTNGWLLDTERNQDSVEVDGVQYHTITLGNQVWMSENLNIETENSYCYKDSAIYCSKYGRLYSWEDAMTVCPAGWHLPDSTEWQELADLAGQLSTYPGNALKSASGWNKGGITFADMGYMGFSAFPAGYRTESGAYKGFGDDVYFWSASESGDDAVIVMYLIRQSYEARVGRRSLNFYQSVRCIMD